MTKFLDRNFREIRSGRVSLDDFDEDLEDLGVPDDTRDVALDVRIRISRFLCLFVFSCACEVVCAIQLIITVESCADGELCACSFVGLSFVVVVVVVVHSYASVLPIFSSSPRPLFLPCCSVGITLY